MSIRRKRRQRGKRKVLRREALVTWERLKQQSQPPVEQTYPGVILPIIRQVYPKMIAEELVGVQPMTLPEGYISYRYSNDRTKKEIQEQRKAERAAKKREKRGVGQTPRKEAKDIIKRCMGRL